MMVVANKGDCVLAFGEVEHKGFEIDTGVVLGKAAYKIARKFLLGGNLVAFVVLTEFV